MRRNEAFGAPLAAFTVIPTKPAKGAGNQIAGYRLQRGIHCASLKVIMAMEGVRIQGAAGEFAELWMRGLFMANAFPGSAAWLRSSSRRGQRSSSRSRSLASTGGRGTVAMDGVQGTGGLHCDVVESNLRLAYMKRAFWTDARIALPTAGRFHRQPLQKAAEPPAINWADASFIVAARA